MSFSYRGLECKSRKSRNTWSKRQIWPWSTEWSRAKAMTVLPRERTGHSKHPLLTTQEKTLHMDITRWSISKPDWLYSLQPKMEKLYTVSKNKTRNWLWLRSETAYCQIRLKLKKVGKTTRPFRGNLNQIPYNYTVEVTNRFKGLDLIDRVPDELWMEVHYCPEGGDQNHPQEKRNAKRQIGCLIGPYKKLRKEEKWKAKEKRKDISIWMLMSSKE